MLAGHGLASGGQAHAGPATTVIAGEGCTSILVGKRRLDRRLGHDHAHLRLRHVRLDLAARPGGRPQARLDPQDLPRLPVQDLAAVRRPQVGPLQEGLRPASRSPRSPTPTPTTTACSAT
ncbi:MAG: hypothetical protein M0C28_27220 [Candidatus Moduliflexus flocculans]|nr:hypothetical protein [Candidatus Moduliflexus flocculans]